MTYGTSAWKKNYAILFLLVVFLTGCINFHVVVKHDPAIPQPQKETRWGWLWGIVQAKDIKTVASCKAICVLTVKRNIGDILISAISLGIAVPTTIEYQCCADEPEPGEF